MVELSNREAKFLLIIFNAARPQFREPVYQRELYNSAERRGFDEREVIDISEQLKESGLVLMKRDRDSAGQPISVVACVQLTQRGIDAVAMM